MFSFSYKMGLGARKPVFWELRTTKAQISHLLFANWKLATRNVSIFYLVYAAEETDWSLALSETPKKCFVVRRLK